VKKNRKDPVFDLERAYANSHRVALGLAATERPGRALDLGAGQGAISQALRDRGFEVTATDVNTSQFRASGVTCLKTDLNRPLPFSEGSFDLVMAVEILEHLESPRGLLREIFRVLRPGGLAVVTTPNITSFPSRVLFLATGWFDLFVPMRRRLQDPLDNEADGHISPVPGWLLRYHLREGGFMIERTRYSMAYIPGVPRAVLRFFHGRLSGRVGLYAVRRPAQS
jgi:SAM-dependent methyltransferase